MKFRLVSQILFYMLLHVSVINGVMAQSGSCEDHIDYITQAHHNIEQSDLITAVQAYDCALQIDPHDTATRLEKLSTSILIGDYMSAYGDVFLLNNTAPATVLTYLDELRPEKKHHKLRAFLAIFAVVPDYELALNDVEKILSIEPENAFAYVIRAVAYEGLGENETAQQAFDRAVALSSADAQLYGLMAAAQFTVFNIQGIRENASKAIDIDPTIAQLYRLRGFTSMVMGEVEAAISDANQAIDIDPDYFAFYVLRGNAYLATDDLESALSDFDQIIALVPQSSFGYALRAQLHLELGNILMAADDLATAIELDTLERIDGDSLMVDMPIVLTMTYGRVYYLPFNAQQGDLLTLSATSVESGKVDSLILILDPDGTPLIYNDDADSDNDVLDAVISEFEVPTDGTYTLVVSHALGGSEGDIDILIAQQ